MKNTEFGCTREENKAPTKPYYFNGNGYASYSKENHECLVFSLVAFRIELPNGGVGKNFTMKLEFKTSKREGILFSASSNKLRDALALELRFGKVSVQAIIKSVKVELLIALLNIEIEIAISNNTFYINKA